MGGSVVGHVGGGQLGGRDVVRRTGSGGCFRLPVVRRARDTTAVVEICRRLDGIALAIELAAARDGVDEPDGGLGAFGGSLPSPGGLTTGIGTPPDVASRRGRKVAASVGNASAMPPSAPRSAFPTAAAQMKAPAPPASVSRGRPPGRVAAAVRHASPAHPAPSATASSSASAPLPPVPAASSAVAGSARRSWAGRVVPPPTAALGRSVAGAPAACRRGRVGARPTSSAAPPRPKSISAAAAPAALPAKSATPPPTPASVPYLTGAIAMASFAPATKCAASGSAATGVDESWLRLLHADPYSLPPPPWRPPGRAS